MRGWGGAQAAWPAGFLRATERPGRFRVPRGETPRDCGGGGMCYSVGLEGEAESCGPEGVNTRIGCLNDRENGYSDTF